MAVEEVASGALMDRDGTAGVLERARQTFARFRKGHPRGRRIPLALRATVVSAVDRGVRRGALARTCGISSAQITAWQCEINGVSRPRARVFRVTDGPGPPSSPAGEQELVLRVGTWLVTVRQDGGGAACSL